MPQRAHYLFVCTNRRADEDARGSCAARGSLEVQRALKEQISAAGLAQFEARACASSCLDQCSSGVTILVEPEHFFYGRVTLADVPEIVEALARGEPVERLLLTKDDLDRVWQRPGATARGPLARKILSGTSPRNKPI